MKKLALILLVVVAGAGLSGAFFAGNLKPKHLKPQNVAGKPKSQKIPTKGGIGLMVFVDMTKVGKEVFSATEAESRVRHRVRIADEKIAGKPMIRVDGNDTILIYPQDVQVTIEPFPWPQRDPRQWYAELVKENNSSDFADRIKGQVRDIGGKPGWVVETGFNQVGTDTIPRPGHVVWCQDGLEYNVTGAPETSAPLSRLLPIAESIASNP